MKVNAELETTAHNTHTTNKESIIMGYHIRLLFARLHCCLTIFLGLNAGECDFAIVMSMFFLFLPFF